MLLAGLTYVDVELLTGWKKTTIKDHAKRAKVELPSPSETARSGDILARAICEDLASQGLTPYEAMRRLRVPRSVVKANWPRYPIKSPVAELKAAAREALERGVPPGEVAQGSGLSVGQVLSLARAMRRERKAAESNA